jgi:hypothetical protein
MKPNQLFPDTSPEGGYNHGELKRVIRAYNPGAGQISNPWIFIKEWLRTNAQGWEDI